MSSPAVSVPLEFLQQLAPLAEQMGVSLPGVARFAPTINIGQPIRSLALEMGRLVAPRDIFLKAGELVTVDPKTGETAPMKPARFVGWVEEFVAISNHSEPKARQSLSREVASLVLEQDIFRECIRSLNGVHLMRLPVRRKDGRVEFLEKGYDVESQIYTVETLSYDTEWTLDQARQWIIDAASEFPWNAPDPVAGQQPLRPEETRSFAVHVAAMVGTYCRAMFSVLAHRPMISYIANQPGSGKSILAAMALCHVHGEAAPMQVPKDDKEMNSQLDTMARVLAPYLFFDDIGYGIQSAPLNQFILSSYRTGRVMGGNSERFRAPVLAQVFATGNDISISADLMRRSLVAELFLAGEVRGRKFRKVIDDDYLCRPEIRGSFLSACCAMVKHWVRAGEQSGRPILHPMPLPSFNDWSSSIGAIVMMAGFSDPLAAPEMTVGASGDSGDDIRELLIRLATAADGDTKFTRKEMVDQAREWELMEGVVGAKGDPDIGMKESKSFGRKLGKWRGRELVDGNGRRFRFGHARQKQGMTYPLTFIVG